MANRLALYSELLDNGRVRKSKPARLEEPKALPPIILQDNSKCITLASEAVETKDIVKVFNLGNYRRKPSAVVLVTDLRISIDNLIFDIRGLLECEATL